MIHVPGLTEELQKAGIAISGCNQNGVVWDPSGNEIQTRPDIAAILAAHDPAKYEQIDASSKIRRAGARSAFASIPEFRNVTADQAASWIENNVTNLVTAKQVLKLFARLLVSMRDELYPDMQDKNA